MTGVVIGEVRCYAKHSAGRPHRLLLATLRKHAGGQPAQLEVEPDIRFDEHQGERPMVFLFCPKHGAAPVDLAHVAESAGATTRGPNVIRVLG